MNKDFIFVDGNKTDRSTRRYARSHAMKGKNLGKTHHRRSRLGRAQRPKDRELALPRDRIDKEGAESMGDQIERLSTSAHQLAVCQALPLPLLFEATPRGLGTIRDYFTLVMEAVYPSKLCLSLDSIRSYWVRMLFVDETSYHVSLALMATLNAFVFATEAPPSEANYHLGKAVGLVKEKLGTAEALTNSNISVVNFLAVRDMYRGDQLSAEIHLKGLLKMVELRGGLSQLEGDCTLALKICKTDIEYAFHYGTPTCFYRDRLSPASQAMTQNELVVTQHKVKNGPRFTGINPYLQRILLDIVSAARWFNGNGAGLVADPNTIQEIIVSAGYRLVQFHSLNESQFEESLEGAYHIGLIAFLTTLFIQYGGRRFFRYSLVGDKLKGVVRRGLKKKDNSAMIWLLFIGGVSVLGESDHDWLLPRISHVARSMDIESWPQLEHLLVQFPWISPLHDELGEALWMAVKTRTDEIE